MDVQIQTYFYTKKEQKAFKKNYPDGFEDLKKFIETNPNRFTYADFQAYYLFMFWRSGHTDWGDFKGIRSRVTSQWEGLNDFFIYDAATARFTSKEPDNNERNEHSEGVGVAGALTLLSSHHDMTEADWERIPISSKKDFDYQIASTGTSFIYVECKGSITSDNTVKQVAKDHKKSIVDKKEVKRPVMAVGAASSGGIYYGIITVADPTRHLQSWFVDPPEPENSDDPRKYKLLARLYFYYRNLSALYQRSPFVTALINRIKVLELAADYQAFDGLHLFNASGEPYYKSGVFLQGYGARDKAEGGEIFGKLLLIGEADGGGQLLFFGFLREVLGFLSNQNIEEITSFSTGLLKSKQQKLTKLFDTPDTGFRFNTTVRRRTPEARFLAKIGKFARSNGVYINISCVIDLQISAAGRAFGLVRTDSIQLN